MSRVRVLVAALLLGAAALAPRERAGHALDSRESHREGAGGGRAALRKAYGGALGTALDSTESHREGPGGGRVERDDAYGGDADSHREGAGGGHVELNDAYGGDAGLRGDAADSRREGHGGSAASPRNAYGGSVESHREGHGGRAQTRAAAYGGDAGDDAPRLRLSARALLAVSASADRAGGMHAAAAAMAAAVVNAAVDDMLGGGGGGGGGDQQSTDIPDDDATADALNTSAGKDVGSSTTTTRADAAAAALAGELDALVGGLDVAETWSAVRAPRHRHAVAAALVVSGALLVVAGYRLLSFWLFALGFTAAALTFFSTAPSVLHLAVCCGPGTEMARLAISGVLGIFGGIAALFVLRIGLFLTGSSLGFLVWMLVMLTPVGGLEMLESSASVAIAYAVAAACGGLCALWLQRPFVVMTTAIGGAFLVCLGLDYELASNFQAAVTLLLLSAQHALNPRAVPSADVDVPITATGYALALVWAMLSVGGCAVQYNFRGRQLFRRVPAAIAAAAADGPAVPPSPRPTPAKRPVPEASRVLHRDSDLHPQAPPATTSGLWSNVSLFRKTDLHAREPTPAALEAGPPSSQAASDGDGVGVGNAGGAEVGAAPRTAVPLLGRGARPLRPSPKALARVGSRSMAAIQRQYTEAIRQLQDQLAAVAAERAGAPPPPAALADTPDSLDGSGAGGGNVTMTL